MAKLTLNNIASGFNLNKINDNFTAIQNIINNNIYFRNNPVGEPNTLETNMDVNNKVIFNLPLPTLPTQAARLVDVQTAFGSANLQSYVDAAAAQVALAATQAGNAATSATNAATQVTLATTQANNAAASYDSFDDRYLGSKASAPTLDNDGNALLTGALYWNSVAMRMFSWTGSAWQDITTSSPLTSGAITTALGYTPVERGTGTSQNNTIAIKIGQSTVDATKVRLERGTTDMGNIATETFTAATYYPNVGGLLSGNIVSTNGNGLFARDTGNTPRQVVTYGGDNNVNFVNGIGGNWRVYNNTAAAIILDLNNTGALSIKGIFTMENSTGIYFKTADNVPRNYLSVGSDNNIYQFCVGGSNWFWFNQAGTVAVATLSNAGAFTAVSLTATSDDRKKKNWSMLTDAQIDALTNMDLVGTFDWKEETGHPGRSIGASAQQIRAIVPEAVHEDDKGNLSVNYGGLSFAYMHGLARRMRDMK